MLCPFQVNTSLALTGEDKKYKINESDQETTRFVFAFWHMNYITPIDFTLYQISPKWLYFNIF